MPPYHLEILDTKIDLNAFSRAHMSYINQIFGDQSVREIIQETYGFEGELVVEDSPFMHTNHHVYYDNRGKKLCSVELGYQDNKIDINDTLCQSYSLMKYMNIPFDNQPSVKADVSMKYNKQIAMIQMYRMLLNNVELRDKIIDDIIFESNNRLWIDSVNHKHNFYMIEKYKNGAPIIQNIHHVLDIWETYGWCYFIEKGDYIDYKTTIL
jgi:hypothetical protein